MSDLMPSSVLLAIIQNQIKNAVNENNVDPSKFTIYKTIGNASEFNVTLETDEYPHVFFHGNYLSNTSGSVIYRFSSGIILDSSSETVQYKIVLATYNVKTAKVTFVEKVLS